ncbi:receptor-type tyrosine-protein phosphatase kappa-like [Ambystoma mexicanum]|uniref:receptor-type tyrosine-protein phosphatase kappa-like n=1 Tax=Ambystoma mexicanum TaxID=8296 RepID=UPI0037E932AE
MAAMCAPPLMALLLLLLAPGYGDDDFTRETRAEGQTIEAKDEDTASEPSAEGPNQLDNEGTGREPRAEDTGDQEKCPLPNMEHLIISDVSKKNDYAVNEHINVSCSEGYAPTVSLITCVQKSDDATSGWSPAVQCIEKCPLPNMEHLIISDVSKKNDYAVNEHINVSCSEGYAPTVSLITCVQNSDDATSGWSPAVQCIEKCPLPNMEHLIISDVSKKNDYAVNEHINVSCSEGYAPTVSLITCVQNSDDATSGWSPAVQCIEKCRKLHITDEKVQLEPIKTYYDPWESVAVSCLEGYATSYIKIQCILNAENKYIWSQKPTCIEKCRKLHITDEKVQLEPIKTYYDPWESVAVSCLEGYATSYIKIQCILNAENKYIWSQKPTCIEKCRKLHITDEKVQLEPIKTYYDPWESVAVSCLEGYATSYIKIQCILNAENKYIWSQKPTCIEIKLLNLLMTSKSIRLKLDCKDCKGIWRTSATARQASCKDHSFPAETPCNVTYPKRSILSVICRPLRPFTQYHVHVNGTYEQYPNITLLMYNGTTRTNETVPEAPAMEMMNRKTETKTIRWKSLSNYTGIVKGYQLNITSWRDYNRTFQETEYVTVDSSVTEYTVARSGTNYTVTIQGFTSAGLGKATTRTFATFISVPIIPPISKLKELNNSATAKTFVLVLQPVTDHNGPISEYQIIVSRQRNSSEDICQREDLAPFNKSIDQNVYITMAFPAHNLTSPVEFVVGDGTYQHGYYNAPFIEDSNYTAFLRVISMWDQEKTHSCAHYGSFAVSQTYQAATMSMALMAALALLVLLVVLVVSIALLRLQSTRPKSPSGATNSILLMKRRTGKMKTKIPVVELLEAMKKFRKAELMEEERHNTETESDPFSVGRFAEYQTLDSGLLYPCIFGTAAENKSKNRYKNIIPYDHSRVVLQSRPTEEDYINASYIDGYKSPLFFIACQGPLPETVADFWQMVWQENSSVIVMLTGIVEKDKVKCEQYWPEESDTYGQFRVTLCSKHISTGHVTRTFSLQKSGEPEKIVEHLHYLAWPDHGVPSKPASLLRLVEKMNATKLPDSGPVIVHCSAGIGRTGTFIALDILLKMARVEQKVDIFQCAQKMREKRVNMIQTKDQYVFLYDALTEGIVCGLTAVPVEEIQQCSAKMRERNPVTKMNGFAVEFQKLQRFSGLYKLYACTQAKKHSNKFKNRDQEILPADIHRPLLMSVTDSDGSPAYINAVYVDSYDKEDHFVVTQLPRKETLVDFWSLVWDYRCTAVVMMNRIEDLDESYPHFWPDNGTLAFGPFQVKLKSESSRAGFTARTLCLSKGERSTVSELEVKLWQLDNWPMQQRQPRNTEPIISIVGEVGKCRENDNHVLVTCWDGASCSGLFLAASNMCEQIREERLVDPSHIVRLLKSRRFQLIPDASQYAFCYQLALSYLDSFETYGNFK